MVIDLVTSAVDQLYVLPTEDVSTTDGFDVVKVVELPAVITGFAGAVRSVTVLMAEMAEQEGPL